MPTFEYEGRDKQGKNVTGKVEADSEDAAAVQLLKQGVTPVSFTQVADKKGKQGKKGQGGTARRSSRNKEPQTWWEKLNNIEVVKEKVKTEDLSSFCRQMSALTRAGASVTMSLRQLGETVTSKPLKEALLGSAENIQAGQTLSSAFKEYRNVFPPTFINILESGEASGELEMAFDQLSGYLEMETKTAKKVKSASRYPMMVIGTVVAALVVMNIFVIPNFASMFEGMGKELPLFTKMLLASSNFMLAYWPWLLGITIALVVGVKYLLKHPKARYTWDRWKIKLPIFGKVTQKLILARFTRTFSLVLKTGVPLVNGIDLVAGTVGNEFFRQRLVQMRSEVERGDNLATAARNAEIFSPLLLQMIQIGEASGELENLINEAAKYYEQESEYDLDRLGEMIEPLLISVMGGMVAILAVGIFMPMFSMANLAGG